MDNRVLEVQCVGGPQDGLRINAHFRGRGLDFVERLDPNTVERHVYVWGIDDEFRYSLKFLVSLRERL